MARFTPNPDFRIENVLEGAKGQFTCPNCGEEFEQIVQRFEDDSRGVVCVQCGATMKFKNHGG